jgi:hypothetical protein
LQPQVHSLEQWHGSALGVTGRACKAMDNARAALASIA